MNSHAFASAPRAVKTDAAARFIPVRIAALFVSVLTAGALWSLPQAASAAAPGAMVNTASGRCLDVRSADTTAGAPVIIYDCHGRANQTWQSTSAGELRALGGTRCLNVRGGSTESRAIVESFTCNGTSNQKWSLKTDGTVVNAKSGLCLTVIGRGTVNGTGINMWPCRNLPHQKWSLAGGASDTVPPTPPSGLTVTTPTCNSAVLTWSAATDNVGIAFYDLYHDGQLLKTVAGNVLSGTVQATPGAQWGFYVNARDAAGNVSQASNNVSKNIPFCETDTQPPTVPTRLRGSVAGTTATLSWRASTDNVGVASYDVFRNSAKIGNTPSLTFTDSGLSPSTTYQYSVAARDAQNNVSSRSSSLSLSTAGSCSNPVCSTVQVATEAEIPWGLLTLSDGSVLYSRRNARDVIRLNPATGAKVSVGTVPNVYVRGGLGEGGLLGLAAAPGFPESDSWLYIYHTSPNDNRIVRMRYQNGQLDTGSLQVLLSGIGFNVFHNGGRLRFGPDGKLYASTGDAQNGAFAQDINNLAGKVLRLNTNGSVPADNPFGNYVWSYGHRNPQGLAFDSQGRLWEQEFGNQTQDETNLIQKGGNYGWPNCEGTASKAGSGCGTPGYIAPKLTYTTDNGSCSGLTVVRDVVYVACLKGSRLYRAVISGSSLTNTQQLFVGTYGRLRTVEPTPDGGIWLTTSNNGGNKILKVTLGQ